MSVIGAVASSVGAGVSQVRSVSETSLKEQEGSSGSARSAAALELIRQALSYPGTTGNDLDVLA